MPGGISSPGPILPEVIRSYFSGGAGLPFARQGLRLAAMQGAQTGTISIVQRIGLVVGLAGFVTSLVLPAPEGMSQEAWHVAGLVIWMAAWWMTQAIPLTATALLPFVVLPFAGAGTAAEVAGDYYSPIMFLLLGGAFLALAIERTGLHRRLAIFVLNALGERAGPVGILAAFMVAAALISSIISNTSTALIMMPMALAVLAGGSPAGVGAGPADRGDDRGPQGLSGALPLGIAMAANIGGLATIIGSPTNALAVALLDEAAGLQIGFALWASFGVPVVLVGIPAAALILCRVQKVGASPFDSAAARAALAPRSGWTSPEKRVLAIIALAFAGWMAGPALGPMLPAGSLSDGTVAILAALALFLLPDGEGRRLLVWHEANRAPWGVIMMFGGGLALAGAISRSGLAPWLGEALLPLGDVPPILVAMALVAMMIMVTEFASNVATAAAMMPVVASLAVALGGDPLLLAMPAAMAASWCFMMPAGTGPNAIAFATGRVRIGQMIRAGIMVDLAGIPLLVCSVWLMVWII